LLNQVVKEYPEDPDVLTTLGNVLLRGKQPGEALLRFEKALVLRPAYAPFEVNVATALLAANNKIEAQRHLEKALQLDPLLQPAVELLRALYRDQGDGSKAAKLATQYRREMDGTPPQ
jgi:predicted Zn-dependent protease